jgi:hypothetical protein
MTSTALAAELDAWRARLPSARPPVAAGDGAGAVIDYQVLTIRPGRRTLDRLPCHPDQRLRAGLTQDSDALAAIEDLVDHDWTPAVAERAS